MQQPIDFVVLWVDGGDPAWLAEKNRYLEQETGKKMQVDASEARYRDWEILHYWFRAVEKYAPWVNRVHFVTCGQVPAWLNLDHPKLHFVQHKDFIPAEYLPTFSSHPIELNLHRIPGLSEQFVYFNDDFFLTAPMQPEDFFVGGLPCDSLAEDPIQFRVRELYNSIRINDIIFANRHFSRVKARKQHWRKWFSLRSPHDALKNLSLVPIRKPAFFGLDIHHLPQAYRKSTFEKVWELEHQWLHETCTHRFRAGSDVSQCVFKFWQLLSGQFAPYNKKKYGKVFSRYTNPHQMAQSIVNRTYKMICINDVEDVDFEESKRIAHEAFDRVLGQKSMFEK